MVENLRNSNESTSCLEYTSPSVIRIWATTLSEHHGTFHGAELPFFCARSPELKDDLHNSIGRIINQILLPFPPGWLGTRHSISAGSLYIFSKRLQRKKFQYLYLSPGEGILCCWNRPVAGRVLCMWEGEADCPPLANSPRAWIIADVF